LGFAPEFIKTSNMKHTMLASLLAGAAAFAPAQQSASTSVSLNNSFENEVGVPAPLGFFDPFGQLSNEDEARFERLRYVEIKHGRIAQLAFLGQITTRAGIHLPGDIDYSDYGVTAIFGPNHIPTAGIVQIISFILECAFTKAVPGTGNEFVGDFRNGLLDFGWDSFDEEAKLHTMTERKKADPFFSCSMRSPKKKGGGERLIDSSRDCRVIRNTFVSGEDDISADLVSKVSTKACEFYMTFENPVGGIEYYRGQGGFIRGKCLQRGLAPTTMVNRNQRTSESPFRKT
jgi:Chlorophyll A-B binding protein